MEGKEDIDSKQKTVEMRGCIRKDNIVLQENKHQKCRKIFQ
jgi:hypothetical protein